MRKFIPFLQVFKQAFTNLQANDPVRMAAATAFFTFFALPPIVIILSTLFSPVVNQQRVRGTVFHQLAELFGRQGANQLKDISHHLQKENSSVWLTLLTGVLLLLASTTLFAVIKNSLNQLWNVKPTVDRTWLNVLKDKGKALAIIVFSGLLLTVSLAVDTGAAQLWSRVSPGLSTFDRWTATVVDQLSSILVMALWFALVFKYLPDLRIRWKAIWVGAIVTSLLFGLGEAILNRLLINSLVSSRYGASGAIILMLLFVFYSSLIFYYGATFTRYYAEWTHLDATPKSHSVVYQITEVDNRKDKSP
ncbi:hypothetical protein GCM10028803_54030 [Larkinella knui]|uniref:YihY/virulence factor BrkB family protein n=1 Tax=Larkinella knui TaxID=2025310 RepID=A0A3P1CGB8_9BACT|nr:YihY/virulence factor BrkB family protein [Larkinella knui]RRB12391.1 YihY/virulence factor BrkB family protein [Larkinella knui]